MTEDAIKRSSELLLQGATMLQIACPDCRNPIYRLKNQSLRCASCDKPVILEKNLTEADIKKMGLDDNPIQKKIISLTKKIEQEEDPDKIIKLAETIKKLKDIL